MSSSTKYQRGSNKGVRWTSRPMIGAHLLLKGTFFNSILQWPTTVVVLLTKTKHPALLYFTVLVTHPTFEKCDEMSPYHYETVSLTV